MTNANIIEGISNETLCCFTVFVAAVVVFIINLVYSWNSGQNAGIRIPANSALSSTLNEDTQGNSTEDQSRYPQMLFLYITGARVLDDRFF